MITRIEVSGRTVIVETMRASRGEFVVRLKQVVKRPRAYGESARTIWPRVKLGTLALAAMAQLGASERSGLIDAALARCNGGAA